MPPNPDGRPIDDRVISIGPGLPPIPERLLLAHARGELLFIAGAGVSQPANLPDFRGLVLKVYQALDAAVHVVISTIPRDACNQWRDSWADLTDQQTAEVLRFVRGDYDVVLGMLERRIDGQADPGSRVRRAIAGELRQPGLSPAPLHRALMRLADRGTARTIITTNFDLLLEKAAVGIIETYSLGGIPRPGRHNNFSGVLHVHGALDPDPARVSDLVLSDQDFGEFYLRRRSIPDLIYDAARLFHLVLIGYSANDPPMRYLLNAVAADGSRFDDLKERFSFIGLDAPNPVELEDWKGRGITCIQYDAANSHNTLLETMIRWADLSAINGKQALINNEIKRIVRTARALAPEHDTDLFDHLVRRADPSERARLSALASAQGADLGWLNAIIAIASEPQQERRR